LKKPLLILLLFRCVFFYSQSGLNENSCGTKLRPNYIQWRNSIVSIQNLVSTLKHDTCLNKKFSLAFHVVLDSAGLWGALTPGDLNNCVTSLNDAFKPICVSFENCYVDVIHNYTYNSWDQASTEPLVLPSWNVENTINIYLVDSILGFPAGYAGSVIVIEKAQLVGLVSIHEMGHFFGLVHTFDEIGSAVIPAPTNPSVASYEFVRRTNCYTNGDGFCDTEADCYPAGYDKNTPLPCKNVPGTVDGYSEYYVPPVDNYMTYFKCACRFTQEQYNFMARVILTSLLYLH
jgi:hypothetical protein